MRVSKANGDLYAIIGDDGRQIASARSTGQLRAMLFPGGAMASLPPWDEIALRLARLGGVVPMSGQALSQGSIACESFPSGPRSICDWKMHLLRPLRDSLVSESGIYALTIEDGRTYVGQSKNISRRLASHLRVGGGRRVGADEALLRCGVDNLRCSLLCIGASPMLLDVLETGCIACLSDCLGFGSLLNRRYGPVHDYLEKRATDEELSAIFELAEVRRLWHEAEALAELLAEERLFKLD